jgi:hypothetical protein
MPFSSPSRERAQAGLLSVVEVYNSLTFSCREEAFAIFAIDAWELLLAVTLLGRADSGRVSRRPNCGRNMLDERQVVKVFLRPERRRIPAAYVQQTHGITECSTVTDQSVAAHSCDC